jgi:hypothetical protein
MPCYETIIDMRSEGIKNCVHMKRFLNQSSFSFEHKNDSKLRLIHKKGERSIKAILIEQRNKQTYDPTKEMCEIKF